MSDPAASSTGKRKGTLAVVALSTLLAGLIAFALWQVYDMAQREHEDREIAERIAALRRAQLGAQPPTAHSRLDFEPIAGDDGHYRLPGSDSLPEAVLPMPGLGRSYGQAMLGLDQIFAMLPGKPVAGRARWIGSSRSHAALIELIGSESDLGEVTLLLGMGADAPDLVRGQLAVADKLLGNLLPSWSEGPRWVEANLLIAVGSGHDHSTNITVDGKGIRLLWRAAGRLQLQIQGQPFAAGATPAPAAPAR